MIDMDVNVLPWLCAMHIGKHTCDACTHITHRQNTDTEKIITMQKNTKVYYKFKFQNSKQDRVKSNLTCIRSKKSLFWKTDICLLTIYGCQSAVKLVVNPSKKKNKEKNKMHTAK